MTDINEKYNQAEALKDEGKLDEAIEILTGILAEEPNHSISHFALAVLYGKIGQHEKAVEHGETALELDPTDPFSYTAMSVTYQRAYAGTGDESFIQKAEFAMEKSRQVSEQQRMGG